MALKIVQFIQIFLFSIVAGQAFFYFIAGSAALRNVSATAFIEQRHAIDVAIAPFLKVIYPLTIGISALGLVLLRQPVDSVLFLLSSVAFVLIILDLAIAMKGNIPLNQLITTWTLTTYPDNWHAIRDQWLRFMQWRQICSIGGLTCLLIGLVWQS